MTALTVSYPATRVHRHLHLSGLAGAADTAQLRTAEFNGTTYLCVPVIALVGDIVVRAMNSEGPEFIPAAELSVAPQSWNGRPCVLDHPNNGHGSANDPQTLEQSAFGVVFNSRFEDNKLKVEAWLDATRAQHVGPEAVAVIERCRAGEMVEVSVGAWITAERVKGIHAGQEYIARWVGIVPDHLAMLHRGATGACSVQAGCGAPRIMVGHVEGNSVKVKETTLSKDSTAILATPATAKRSLRERLRSLFTGDALDLLRFRGSAEMSAAEESVSDQDLRSLLDRALFAEEPGYLGIDAVFPAESLVIYAVAPDQKVILYRRSYTLGDDTSVSLAAEKEAVEPVTRYEPVNVTAAAGVESTTTTTTTPTTAPITAASCGCQTHKGATSAKEEEAMPTPSIAERVLALTANKNSRLSGLDPALFAGLAEPAVKALEEEAAKPPTETPPATPTPPTTPTTPTAPTPTPPAEPTTASAPPKEPTEDEWLAKAPAHLRAMVTEHKAAEAARRATFIAKLKAAQTAYTEEQLAAKTTEDLALLSTALKLDVPARDFSGRGLPVSSAATRAASLPDTYGLNKAKSTATATAGKEAN